MKDQNKILLIFLNSSLFASLFYFLALRIRFFDILFFDGIFGIFLGITLFICALLTYLLIRKKLNIKTNFRINIIKTCLSILVITSSPALFLSTFHSLYIVSLDRSLSVYVLSYLDKFYANKSFSDIDISQILSKGYFGSDQAVQRRIKEQISMKYFIPINENEYILSNKGKRFVKMSRLFVKFFSVDEKFTNPKQVNF